MRQTPVKPSGAVRTVPLKSLKSDPRNANKGTPRGTALLEKSLSEFGAGRSILLDKNGVVLAGNKTWEQAGALGFTDVMIVSSDGKKLIAVQRTDVDIRTKRGKALAVSDNRAGELNLEWDAEVLAELDKEIDLSGMFSEKELVKFLATPSDGESKSLPEGFGIMIEGISEAQQIELLERLTEEGLTCRALTF